MSSKTFTLEQLTLEVTRLCCWTETAHVDDVAVCDRRPVGYQLVTQKMYDVAA